MIFSEYIRNILFYILQNHLTIFIIIKIIFYYSKFIANQYFNLTDKFYSSKKGRIIRFDLIYIYIAT